MASFAVAGSISFCLLLLAFPSPRAQARESQFFSRFTRYDTEKTPKPTKEELPAVKTEEPVQYTPDSGNGYGLYGHGPEKLPPATTTGATPSSSTYSYDNANENLPSEFPNSEFTSANYESREFNEAGYPENNNLYGYDSKTPYNAGTTPQNEPSSVNYYKKSKEANTRYPSYANEGEQLGLSDTRFLENGRYFYDLNAEENLRNSRYNHPQAYGSAGGTGTFPNGGYSYGNGYRQGNGFGENAAMEGYQNNPLGNTQENQERYTP